jgi:membrane associated rhomboid family serine protease
MFLIPIGLEQATVRRLPWVSIAIIAANVIAFVTVGTSGGRVEEDVAERGRQVSTYWQEHPYLKFPERLLADKTPAERRQLEVLIEAMKSVGRKPPLDTEQVRREQHKLDGMVEAMAAAVGTHPVSQWGLVPAHPTARTFITSMFMHAGWLHLLGNMLIFYIAGPFVEDAFGRPLFALLYIASGVVAALVHIVAFPDSTSPLVGASGAIAGTMGAFLVRFVRARVRFFYVFWLFFLARFGTFAVPAWVVLPLWLFENLFFAALAHGTGVAYWAHVGGFVFGLAAALGIKALAVEQKYVAPKIEKEISVKQHPELERGMTELGKGAWQSASEAFRQVLAAEPRNPDANLGLWQCAVAEGDAAAGASYMVRVIEEELRRGEDALALAHWRELVKLSATGGPPAMRWRLATLLEPQDPPGAVEVYRHLAADITAGLLQEKASRRLAALVPDEPAVEARREAAPAAFGAEPPAEPNELTLDGAGEVRGASDGRGDASPFEIEVCQPERLQAEGLLLRGEVGAAELLPFSQIQAIAVAGVASQPRPYLVLDLVLRPIPGEHQKAIRLVGSTFDPRVLAGTPDQKPVDAFRELVRVIAAGAGVCIWPENAVAPGGRFTMFASVEEYERTLLAPLA